MFHKTISTGKNCQRAEFVANELGKVINSIGQFKVIAVCTDNAGYMTKAWVLLEVKYRKAIQYYGCVAHVLENLIEFVVQLHSLIYW